MPKQPVDHGSTIVDGKLRRCSVSMVERANTSKNGCLRSLYYRDVLKWKEPIKRDKQGRPIKQGKDVGQECHDEIQHYLTTGEQVLGRIAAAAKRYMPLPRSLGVEVEMNIGGMKSDLSETILEIEGVPFVGYIDILDRRGQYLNEDADGFFADPLDTVEVLDWKFGSAKVGAERCFAKKATDLRTDTQMMTYGLVPFTLWPGTEWVRLSHVYTNTKDAPTSSKVSTLVSFDALDAFAERTKAIVRTIKDVVAETDPEHVPGNSFACLSFGGCPWMENCSHWKQSGGLESFYGASEVERINMGILDGISLPGMPGNPPVTATPTAVAATIPLVPQSSHDVLAQIASVANAPPPFRPAQPTREFADAIVTINSKGYGFVALAGAAAQMFGVLNQHANVGADYAVSGFGTLGASGKVVDDPNVIVAIARDMQAVPVNPKGIETRPNMAPGQLGILSPSAPASNPALAADPVPGFTPAASSVTPGVQVPGLVASVQPAAAAAVIAQTAGPATSADNLPPAEKPKRKYTRKVKTDGSGNDAGAPAGVIGAGDTEHEFGGGSWLFICARPNINVIDLSTWVATLCDDIARHHQLVVPDLRTAKGDHPLSFGAWKGHLSAYARAACAKLEPGAYYLRVTGNEINECVLEGLRAAKTADGNPVFELVVFGE